MRQIEEQPQAASLGGYLLIPHELLHVLGYRVLGKRCRYRWGESCVWPFEPVTMTERLVGLLFPWIVFTTLVVICAVLSTLAYAQALKDGGFFWFIFWTAGALATGIYAGTTVTDLRKAYLLIFNQPWHSRTPFDIFFWPVVDWDEVRQKVTREEHDAPPG